MDTIRKIDMLRVNRGWSFYKLSQESGLSQQTFTQWMNRTSEPSLFAITRVCEAFGITLATFFSENNLVEVTPETKKLYDDWCALSKDEQESVKSIVNSFMKKKQ